MEFVRTPHGLKQYPAFLGVKKVFFCEGKILTSEAAENELTLDEIYWTKIIEKKYPGESFIIQVKGSKTQVISHISSLLSSNNICSNEPPPQDVFGCVDRDYDDFDRNEQIYRLKSNLLITDGYSVENDLLLSVSLEKLVRFLFPGAKAKMINDVIKQATRLDHILKRLVMIDIEFRRRGISFLPTDNDVGFIYFQYQNNTPKTRLDFGQYSRFRKGKFRALAFDNYKSFRGLSERQQCYDFKVLRPSGILHAPGKLIISLLSRLFDAFDRQISSAAKHSPARTTGMLVAHFRYT